MTQELPVLPAGTAGLDVYANVAKTAKKKDAITMESAKAGVKVHIMGNVVMFLVLRRIVKNVNKCLATVQSALKDCMG